MSTFNGRIFNSLHFRHSVLINVCLFLIVLATPYTMSGQARTAQYYPDKYHLAHRVTVGDSSRIIYTNTSACTNSDFTQGTWNNWWGCYGLWCADHTNLCRCTGGNSGVPVYNPACNNTNMPWYNTPTGGHFAISNPGPDGIVPIQKVFPGDAHSGRIGNYTSGSSGGGYIDQATYTLTYDPANSFLIYRCAVVLMNPADITHNTDDKRPRFTFKIKDHTTGTLMDPTCGYYDLRPNDNMTTWDSIHVGSNWLKYLDWVTIGIDLSGLSGIIPGQQLDIEYMVHGCAFQAHAAWAYVESFCGAMTIEVEGCEGAGSVTLTGPPGFVTYVWQGPFCPTCTLPPPTYNGQTVTITTAQGAVSGNTFALTVTALNGCQVTNVQQVIGFTQIHAGYYYSPPVCVGSPVAFFDTSRVNQNQVVNWKWNFGDGTGDFTGSKNITHTFANAGTFNVKLISYSTEGCSDTVIHPITLAPPPLATISGTTTVCKNGTQPLITFTGSEAVAPYTFTYKINGGANQLVTTTSGNSVTVAAPTNVTGTFIYSLVSVKESSSNSCTYLQSGTATITVSPLPTATVSGTTTVCQNANAPLITFTGASGTAPYTFTYNINGGTAQTVTTTSGNSVTLAAPTNIAGTFIYNLTSVQEGSSAACSQAQSGSATVIVNPLPTATIGGTTSVCQNGTDPLITFTGALATAPYTFTYKINGGSSQVVTTTSGSSVTVPAPTNTIGTFVYELVSVQDGSSTACIQAQTGSATITVNPLPTATIDGTISVCQNASPPLVTFTGAAATAPYTFTYNINGGASQLVTTTSGSSVTIAAPTSVVGAFTYNLLSVQDGSTTTCSQAQSGSATITVNPLPTATISGTTAVCQNSTPPQVTFTGASSTAPYTFTYTINGGSNLFVTTTSGNSVTVDAPTGTVGTFTYSLVSVQDGSSTVCSQPQSGTATIIVNPLPTASVSGSTAVCQNATAPLVTFTGASSTAPYTFSYDINGGSVLTVTTTIGNSITVAAPTGVVGSFTYNLLSVQDGSGTVCSQSQGGSATITVNPLPTASISGSIDVCRNATAPLVTFTGASATAPYTFSYNINGGSVLTVTTTSGNSITVAAPTNVVGSFTYNLLSVQDGSSTACSQAQSGSVIINVNPLPTASISGTTAVCQNATSPLITFTGASSSAPYTFTYKINGGADLVVSTTAGNSVTVAAPTGIVGTFIYSLVSVQDGSATLCSQPQVGSATITVNPLPTASIAGNSTLCQYSTAPLITFTGASATAPYTFTYNINGGASLFVTTSVGNSVTITAPSNVSGTFVYNLLSVQDGSSTACTQAQSGSATITVYGLPTASVSGTTSVCQNSTPPLITFTGSSGAAPYTFTYNLNGGGNQVITTTSGNSVTIAAPTNVLGTFTYNLVSVQEGSPLACSQSQTGSATVTVNLLPTATISGTTPVCQNAAAPLITFTGASTAPPYTFTYNINGGANQFVTTTSGSSVTVPAPTNTTGIFTYNLLFVQDGSATPCAQAQGGSATITVRPLPTATISGTTAVCRNATSPLVTFTGASSTAPYTFTYHINGGANLVVTTTSGNSVTISAPTGTAGTFIYTLVRVQDGSSTACSQAQNGSATITVNPLPTATISGTTAVCNNSAPPLITFTGASATAPYTFTYKINGGANQLISTSAGNSVTLPAPTSTVGTFIYSLVSVQEGSSTACSQAQGGSATVTVNPLPYVNFTTCNDLITTSTSRSFTLKGGVPPGGTYYIDGVPAAGGIFNPSVLSTTSHQVTYSYTDFNICRSTSSSVFINIITGSASGSCPQSFIDPRDNTLYKAFTLGGHCWMLTDLNFGTKMASPSTAQTDNCLPEKYCLASDATCSTYGGLYQWDELMQYQVPASGLTVQGLCPPEWHVPTQAEWTDLINSVASLTPGDGLAGSFLKDPTPTFGFHALLDGIFYLNNTWAFTSGSLTATMYWTSTTDGPYRVIARGMNVYTYSVSFYPSLRANAFTVRCAKD
jgi:uncharacterized protein (TIGR02145 family)